ncbi:MAG: hypothetical protein WC239_10690 [Sphaerochaetaceae bacterium]
MFGNSDMAKRRMFSMDIIDTDHFLDMPATTQLLYFHLSMRADDDGFVSSPKGIIKLIGASEDDMKLLIGKQFAIRFDSGICVIKHWKIHNYIQKDRYRETIYQEEKLMMKEDINGAYLLDTECIQNVSKMDTQVRLGKDSLGKLSKEEECPELSHEISGTPFIDLPKIGSVSQPDKVHTVTEEDIAQYQEVYPNVDVKAELKKMKLWLDANPSKRKKNVKSFIARWLAKEQDKPQPKRKKTFEEIKAEMIERYGDI